MSVFRSEENAHWIRITYDGVQLGRVVVFRYIMKRALHFREGQEKGRSAGRRWSPPGYMIPPAPFMKFWGGEGNACVLVDNTYHCLSSEKDGKFVYRDLRTQVQTGSTIQSASIGGQASIENPKTEQVFDIRDYIHVDLQTLL